VRGVRELSFTDLASCADFEGAAYRWLAPL